MTQVLDSVDSRLAIEGGTPIWRGGWPAWPQPGSSASARVQRVVESGRWAISGVATGHAPVERLFAERFAAYVGTRYCVPVDHGSSALVAALQAIGVRCGDEVIVPGLTWVACASTVLRVNAVPVLVDIDPATMCLAPAAVEAAITPKTVAILAVHLYSAMADVDALRAIAARHRLALIEDCAQAHGAEWNGRRAGTFGDIGTFSMQQGKALTSGEGGAVVTSDSRLHVRLEQSRADGRVWEDPLSVVVGHSELRETGEIQGFNYCLSEVQAALLLDGLDRLDDQIAHRARQAARLDDELRRAPGLVPVSPSPANTRRAYYQYAIRFAPDAFAGRRAAAVCAAVEAELGVWVHPPYRPLNAHPLYRPERWSSLVPELAARVDPARFDLPEATFQADHCLLFHHACLLGSDDHAGAIAAAILKVQRLADRLPPAA